MADKQMCLDGGEPTAAAKVPSEGEFYGDHKAAPELKRIVADIAAKVPGMSYLNDYEIACFWKAKAGKSGGRLVYGKAQKASGLLALTTEADFVIVIAADMARMLSALELEALVFHQCCHIEVETDAAGNETPIIAAHDVEMFASEMARYGVWNGDTRRAEIAVRQLALDLGDTVKTGKSPKTAIIGNVTATDPDAVLNALTREPDAVLNAARA